MLLTLCLQQCCLHNKKMLSRNALIFSAVVCLAIVVTGAPVEDKEVEEPDIEREEGEEELSEEEEDDDDSKFQDMNMGIGGQQATPPAKDQGQTGTHEASFESDPYNGQKMNGARPSHGSSHDVSSSDSAVEEGTGVNGADMHGVEAATGYHGAAEQGSLATQLEFPGGEPVHVSSIMSEGQAQAEGPHQAGIHSIGGGPLLDANSHGGLTGSEGNGPDAPETESNGNSYKLLAGGSLALHTVSDLPPGDTFYGGSPGWPTGSSVQPDAPGLAGDMDITQNSSTGGWDHLAVSDFSGTTTDAIVQMAVTSQTEYLNIDHPVNGADFPPPDGTNSNGNGRQRPIAETHSRGDQPFSDIHHDRIGDPHGASQLGSAGGGIHHVSPQTGTEVTSVSGALSAFSHMDLTGMGGEPVTSSNLQLDITAPGSAYSSSPPDMGLGGDAMTSNHIDSTGWVEPHSALIQNESPVTGNPFERAAHTDTADVVTADPRGLNEGFIGHPSTTMPAHSAVPAGEQYSTSGQGSQGAQNVELEDTC